jgi:hypothetical protein
MPKVARERAADSTSSTLPGNSAARPAATSPETIRSMRLSAPVMPSSSCAVAMSANTKPEAAAAALRVRLQSACDQQLDHALGGDRLDAVAASHAELLGERRRQGHRAGRREQREQVEIAAEGRQLVAKRGLDEGIEAQQQDTAPAGQRERALDRGRSRSVLPVPAHGRAQLGVQALLQAAGTRQDLVGGAAHDHLGGNVEGAPGAGAREIDAEHHGDAKRHAGHRERVLPGMTREKAAAGAGQQPAHGLEISSRPS